MVPFLSFTHLSDAQLRAELPVAASTERTATARVIALLAEYDKRRLYFEDGFNSLFAYCTGGLLLSESAAYTRIQAARAARKWPSVLEALTDGSLTLTAVGLLAPHLTDGNWPSVLAEARYKTKADVERLVARLHPRPDVPSAVRKLPAPGPAPAAPPQATWPAHASQAPALALAEPPAPAEAPALALAEPPAPAEAPAPPLAEPSAPALAEPPAPALADAPPTARGTGPAVQPARSAVIAPLSPERYRLQVTIDEQTHDLLRQARDLMRHVNPTGDPAVIVSKALRVLVDDLLKKKAAITTRPRASRTAQGSRDIPAAVRRDVWTRDGGQCTHQGPHGRCPEKGFLEFHHLLPFARGGPPTAANLALRCRAHNLYQARLDGLAVETDRGTGG